MFCPGCGSKNSVDQRFCRSCGLNLEQTAQSLVSQKPSAAVADLKVTEKRLEKFGNIAFGGLGVVCLAAVIGIIYAIVDAFILSGENVIAGIIFILFLIFAMLGLAYVLFNEHLKEKKLAARNPNMQAEIEGTPTGKLLEEKHFEPVPSVTENTTELLKIERKDK